MTTLHERLRESSYWTVVAERDLTYFRVGEDDVVVVACDSGGGLGPKPHDTVQVDGGVLGRFAARVPLLECVAAGAQPLVVVDTLAVERDPTGERIIAGVVAEAASAGVGADHVTGSTEDNVPTVATGIGVTVIGRTTLHGLRVGRAVPPFSVVLYGRPMSAPADIFGPDHREILTVPTLRTAIAIPGVLEALPIGSSGVTNEFAALARTARGTPEYATGWPCALDQSGGPSTAALLAVEHASLDRALTELADLKLPTAVLGQVL